MTEDNAEGRVIAELRRVVGGATPGTRLPSVRELMGRHRASPLTVQRAVARLAAEGLVDPRPGRGTYVAAAPDGPGHAEDLSWQPTVLGERPVDATDLADLLDLPAAGLAVLTSGYLQPDLQPTGAISAALARAARRPGVWERGPTAGLPELRAWFAAQTGSAAGAGDVVVCPGGQAALSTALRALGSAGTPLLVESPTYVGALAAARHAGLRPVPVPADADGVRPDRLADAFRATGARLAYLQPLYANPHGAVLAADRRAAVLEAAADAGAFLIEDDWGRDLTIDADPPPPLAAEDRDGHVVHVRSLTKSAAPGLRVAAVTARGPAGARLRAARLVDDLFVSAPLQQAALELVGAPAWRAHLRALRPALRARRDALLAALAHELPGLAPIARPAGGLHLWVALGAGLDDVAVARAAQRAGVAVYPGRPWFAGQPPGPHLRLTFGGAEPAALAEGVRRLAPLLR